MYTNHISVLIEIFRYAEEENESDHLVNGRAMQQHEDSIASTKNKIRQKTEIAAALVDQLHTTKIDQNLVFFEDRPEYRPASIDRTVRKRNHSEIKPDPDRIKPSDTDAIEISSSDDCLPNSSNGYSDRTWPLPEEKPDVVLISHIPARDENLTPSRHHSKRLRGSNGRPQVRSTVRRISKEPSPLTAPSLTEIPEHKIDQGRRKNYKKSRYMALSASKEFRKGMLVCDIADNEVIYYDVESQTSHPINRHTILTPDGGEVPIDFQKIHDPSAACFLEEFRATSKRSNRPKWIAILSLDGIRVLKIIPNNDGTFIFHLYYKYTIAKPEPARGANGRPVTAYMGLFTTR